jgi:hypothetical protein
MGYWFAASDGGSFIRFLQPMKRVAEFEKSGGAFIVYTHLANGFVRDGRLNSRFQKVI